LASHYVSEEKGKKRLERTKKRLEQNEKVFLKLIEIYASVLSSVINFQRRLKFFGERVSSTKRHPFLDKPEFFYNGSNAVYVGV